jgi:hypothetical protein
MFAHIESNKIINKTQYKAKFQYYHNDIKQISYSYKAHFKSD